MNTATNEKHSFNARPVCNDEVYAEKKLFGKVVGRIGKVAPAAASVAAGAVAVTASTTTVAHAAWATAIDFTGLMADLLAVGGLIMGVVLLVYGFRQVKGMLGRG